MNLELPFDLPSSSELDEHLARIDDQLDGLFLDEVATTLARLRSERSASPRVEDAAA